MDKLQYFLSGNEIEFLIRLGISALCGIAIGIEREAREKPAGISTNCFVIGGAALFTFLSISIDPNSPARLTAQIISGIGFLGAGMILRGDGGAISNLTTAASVWFAAAIGIAIGFSWYGVAIIATIYSIMVPRIPHVSRHKHKDDS